MAHIKSIDFAKVEKMEGCTCDRCGQYITNIWTVKYTDGITVRFGIDCFEKLNKASGLSNFGRKELNKALKSIQKHREMYEQESAKTEQTDTAWQYIQEHDSEDYWYGRPWEEYHEWMLTEWYKARFEEDQKQIDRFSKVNFAR